jgi:hypothetical protein
MEAPRGACDVGTETWGAGVPPPRVFWEKRLQAIENKGRALKKETKEAARIWKQKGWCELQAGIVRGNTRKGTTALNVCQ